jgi:hypothetical protein
MLRWQMSANINGVRTSTNLEALNSPKMNVAGVVFTGLQFIDNDKTLPKVKLMMC